jgi:ribose transport system permease protein
VRKVVGLAVLLAALIGVACLWEYMHQDGVVNFIRLANIRTLLTWVGLFGILSLGQALVIVVGGIDLSVGSVVGLTGILLALLLNRGQGMPPVAAIPLVLAVCTGIGIWHGALVAKARMQPFVVTLCGLFFYRGIARLISHDRPQGFGGAYPWLSWFGNGYLGILDDAIAAPFVILMALGIVVGAWLHFAPSGRHLFALGANEDTARFSGIRTDRLKILAYSLCSLLTGVGGMLLAFKVGSLSPSTFGSFYELYAIAGAVLGGCSLRGGLGNIAGVIIGSSLIVVLRNLVVILRIRSELEYVVIGGAILIGVFVDEMLVRRSARKVAAA